MTSRLLMKSESDKIASSVSRLAYRQQQSRVDLNILLISEGDIKRINKSLTGLVDKTSGLDAADGDEGNIYTRSAIPKCAQSPHQRLVAKGNTNCSEK